MILIEKLDTNGQREWYAKKTVESGWSRSMFKKFTPADAGQMNFYLSVVDDKLKNELDNPLIGMILCKTKNNLTVEYALRDINKPMGVAGYETTIMESLPKKLKGSLPTVKEFEAELLKNQKDD